MSRLPNSYVSPQSLEYQSRADTMTVAQFFNAVYAWMCVGLAVTALVGWYVSRNVEVQRIIYASRGTYLLIALAAFGIAWIVQTQAAKISVVAGTALFLLYAA